MPNNDSNYIQTYNHPHGQVLLNEQTLTDIADAIREQRLTDDRFKPAQFAGEIMGINEIEGGEYEGETDLSVEEKDVNFYDYDGTRVYSYGKEEFLGLSSLPDNPSHDNLVAQGWNWSLSDAKEYVQNYGILDIGQMYDAKTSASTYGSLEIDIELKEGYLTPTLSVDIIDNSTGQQYYINWGDSQAASLPINTINLSHTYNTPGKYTIKVSTVYSRGNAFSITGTSSGSSFFTGGGTNDDIYRNCITAVRIGSCVEELGDYAFKDCHSLKTISLHEDLNFNNAESCFQNCYSLKTIVLPNGSLTVQYIETAFCANCVSLQRVIFASNSGTEGLSSIFYNCYSLKNIIILDGNFFWVSDYMFQNCVSLSSITIPKNLNNNSLQAYGRIFTNCYSLKKIEIYKTIPYNINPNTFRGLPIYTKIYVPWSRDHSVLQAYKTALYWSAIADQIYQMPVSIENTQAYAQFDSSDGSLTFFRDLPNKYTNNQVDGTKTYYTDIETRTGSSTSNAPWYSNRASVQSIIFEDIIIPKSTACWFYGMNFTSIVGLEKLNTSNVTSMYGMFYQCQNLTSLDLSYFDTSNVTNMNYMFDRCSNLTSLNLSYFDTSNVTSMGYMFRDCQNLTSLDLSHFNTSNVTSSMGHMFYNCSNLTTTFNIMNMPSNYNNMCYDAATVSGSQITLKYISPVTSANIDTLVATKSSSSNVINGGQGTFVPPTPSIGGAS